MVTPTRIIQKNWSKTFYLLYLPPPHHHHHDPPPPPPSRKRDSRELDFALRPAMLLTSDDNHTELPPV